MPLEGTSRHWYFHGLAYFTLWHDGTIYLTVYDSTDPPMPLALFHEKVKEQADKRAAGDGEQ